MRLTFKADVEREKWQLNEQQPIEKKVLFGLYSTGNLFEDSFECHFISIFSSP
jgi:hypothetical protein